MVTTIKDAVVRTAKFYMIKHWLSSGYHYKGRCGKNC